ncbi:hypothetical protein HHL08_04890 [Sphingobium sp. AR-3-1]|uniref:Uncharacterized protein n=1 Tax=Sphingobium psychrophilum TaxID=2728834 RepID=A0A7X9WTB8_9SPHN|nr:MULTISPECIES: hypothetical protein [Sphingobium]NML09484.1 hypothetical protein [Sphingobium psychrophilum]
MNDVRMHADSYGTVVVNPIYRHFLQGSLHRFRKTGGSAAVAYTHRPSSADAAALDGRGQGAHHHLDFEPSADIAEIARTPGLLPQQLDAWRHNSITGNSLLHQYFLKGPISAGTL